MDGLLATRLILRTFGAGFPRRLSFGICVGLVFDGVRLFVGSYYGSSSAFGSALLAVPSLYVIAAGLVLVFIPLLSGRRIIPELVTQFYDILDEGAYRLKLTPFQRAQLYQSFFHVMREKFPGSLVPDPTQVVNEALKEFQTTSAAMSELGQPNATQPATKAKRT